MKETRRDPRKQKQRDRLSEIWKNREIREDRETDPETKGRNKRRETETHKTETEREGGEREREHKRLGARQGKGGEEDRDRGISGGLE